MEFGSGARNVQQQGILRTHSSRDKIRDCGSNFSWGIIIKSCPRCCQQQKSWYLWSYVFPRSVLCVISRFVPGHIPLRHYEGWWSRSLVWAVSILNSSMLYFLAVTLETDKCVGLFTEKSQGQGQSNINGGRIGREVGGICAVLCLVAQSCLTLCNPVDYSPPGSSVHGILQTRVLQWVSMLSSRGIFWPKDPTHVSCVSCIVGRFFTTEPPGKP